MEVAGRDVFEPGSLFEIADRELDEVVTAVELVELDRGAVDVGEIPKLRQSDHSVDYA